MPEAGSSILKGRRVLIVEDEYFLAEDAAGALRLVGAEVVGPFGELDDAVRAFVGKPFDVDLAVLDINLKGDMVFPFADELRSRSIPFLFSSGYDRAPIPDNYAGVTLLEKPVDGLTLIRALETLARANWHTRV